MEKEKERQEKKREGLTDEEKEYLDAVLHVASVGLDEDELRDVIVWSSFITGIRFVAQTIGLKNCGRNAEAILEEIEKAVEEVEKAVEEDG